MKRILLLVMILCMTLLIVGAQESVKVEPEPVPVARPVTRLTIRIIDEMNDKMVELNNCIVQVVGELHICEDSFNYSNSFTEGDKYEMVIWVKLKK